MRFEKRCLARAVGATLLFSVLAVAQAIKEPPQPKLVVVLVIDQFRADYLELFRGQFGPGGFNRLMRQGAYFSQCFYPYARTETAPGHATLATGTTPDRHGIAANTWYDARRKRVVQAIEDDQVMLVGASTGQAGASPRNLLGTTLADELRLATGGRARVFGVALKDRAAILSTGHTASAAYWYDSTTGSFITSSYYLKALPAWVTAFNDRRPAGRYYGQNWTIGGRVAVDMTTPEGKPTAEYYRRLPLTPYANELTVEFARELIEKEGLGQDDFTDFLFIGFSANDSVGHRWGPYSEEVAEMTLRTDQLVADLLAYLDERTGRGNYWFVVSADHGVAPTLAQARGRGIPAKNLRPEAVQEAVVKALTERWGAGDWLVSSSPGEFNRETLAKFNVSAEEAAKVAGEAAMAMDGIVGYVAEHSAQAAEATLRAYRRSYFPGRSPDLYLVQEPFSLWNGDRGQTSHGTPYSYDTHVPLILFGPAFRAGVYQRDVFTIDLAPTLAAALRLNPPALATGKVLAEALEPAGARSGPARLPTRAPAAIR